MLKNVITILLITCFSNSLIAQYAEHIEPDFIKTIQFAGDTKQSQLPIISLGEALFLSFDDLNGNEADYYYQITHHDFDWALSDLTKGEYMSGFDDVRIYNYENSFNTFQSYSHYTLKIPNRDTRKLTKSGNYMISIFDDNGEIVFSRRFMIVENIVSVPTYIKRARDLKSIETKQVVQFTIDSPNLLITNPDETIKTLILQNSNLNNSITNLKPQYTIGSQLIYRYDKEASFYGGNEFLYFDNKDIRAGTSTIRRIDLTDIYNHFLYTNGARFNRPYTYNPDINGNYQIRVLNANTNMAIEADYARVYFALQYFEEIADKEIHVYGNFNNWTIDGSTYMEYDSFSDTYINNRLFKQGFYNYKFVLVNRDGTIEEGAISGNYWQTENEYTVLVYYRDLGARYDRIIGMSKANSTSINNQ
ncbi:MAG: type IX secretion system plug protein [Flavobacteriales bacterium]